MQFAIHHFTEERTLLYKVEASTMAEAAKSTALRMWGNVSWHDSGITDNGGQRFYFNHFNPKKRQMDSCRFDVYPWDNQAPARNMAPIRKIGKVKCGKRSNAGYHTGFYGVGMKGTGKS